MSVRQCAIGAVAAMSTMTPLAWPGAVLGAEDGQSIYEIKCAACHRTGLLGAPRVGEAADWEGRTGAGRDALVARAVTGIGKIHGTAQKRDNIIYYAMYHPAAALHQQSLKQTIEADMMKIPGLLTETETVPETGPQPQQLNMFEV